ncbi:Rieske (2Fe-2S) protein [Mycolicibacterium pulveris]|uniref:Rieske domain-containing protein n=1 Tax=Mycolicibacterium pulveris TaxID=36813 RepID=A0A7I7USY3_MYCPV|nr:Rieske (2Fe-2S) protein [Mycolicibacterium pulveris]MCV6983835.1 Rieske (2Fe-2S) protein [Mycolicibacterium pulveris]BBY83719.1 hypothetical protein MPUL_48770 [Mycolicibacterium pulveris]
MSIRDGSVYGWLPVAVADELGHGAVMPIRVHSDEVVLWRGESGEPHALDAYCAHLGHHLGYGGRVCGEDVRCFYHGWTWSPQGTNTDVPYDRRPYKGRRLGIWSVAERAGLIYLWHPGDADTTAPGLPAPELPLSGTDFVLRTDVAADPRLIVEHLVDPVTLGAFLQARPARSDVTARTDSRIVVHHEFAERAPVDVEVHAGATVVVMTDAWSLMIAVCPVSAGNSRVWAAVEATCAGADQRKRQVHAAVDRGLELAARMVYVPVPQGEGADIVDTYRQWAGAERASPAGVSARPT